MTRKHFEAIAAALADARPDRERYTKHSAWGDNTMFNGIAFDAAYSQWERDRANIISAIRQFNDYFDRARFIAATEA